MKVILMSIKPKYVSMILNKTKTIEVRKRFPSDYVGWVYIYCTKDNKNFAINYSDRVCLTPTDDLSLLKEGITTLLNGKVVARFWCDKVEEHRPFFHWCIEKETRLTRDDVLDYLDSEDKFVGNPKRQDKVCAIHITKLEIFDKPKEISEFCKVGCLEKAKHYIETCSLDKLFQKEMPSEFKQYILTSVPQSWCYVEI